MFFISILSHAATAQLLPMVVQAVPSNLWEVKRREEKALKKNKWVKDYFALHNSAALSTLILSRAD